MHKIAPLFLGIVLMMLMLASVGSATIHPIVESFDCANEQAFTHHPAGDVAEPPGQTPGANPGNGKNVFAALSNANAAAFSDFKVNGTCGNAPTP